MHKSTLYKIGDLSRLSGVPVQTIRYYSNIGVLPASSTTEAKYRLYTDADLARLELIRTLRDAGFGLLTISEVLQNEIGVTSSLALQLNVLAESRRRIQRQETLIKAAMQRGEQGALAYLTRAQVLIKLDANGRKQFINEHFGLTYKDVAGPLSWKTHIRMETDLDLAGEISGEQFDAWLGIADLMLDKSFLRYMTDLASSLWESFSRRSDVDSWYKDIQRLLDDVLEAALQGETPEGKQGQTLLQRFIDLHMGTMGPNGALTSPHDLLNSLEGLADPRNERYWELLGILKGVPDPKMWSNNHATTWLVQALQGRLAGEV